MKILVALDGSQPSESSVAATAGWARASDVEVVLCSVLHPNEIHATEGSDKIAHANTPEGTASGTLLPGVKDPARLHRVAEDRTQALSRAHSERQDYLAALARKHLDGVNVEYAVIDGEDSAEAIIDEAGRQGADIIVMATRARSALGQALFGAVHEKVVRESPIPVLLVGPGTRALRDAVDLKG